MTALSRSLICNDLRQILLNPIRHSRTSRGHFASCCDEAQQSKHMQTKHAVGSRGLLWVWMLRHHLYRERCPARTPVRSLLLLRQFNATAEPNLNIICCDCSWAAAALWCSR